MRSLRDKEIQTLNLSLGRKVFNKPSFQLQIRNKGIKEERKKKRESKDEMKNELARSLVEGEAFENE